MSWLVVISSLEDEIGLLLLLYHWMHDPRSLHSFYSLSYKPSDGLFLAWFLICSNIFSICSSAYA